MRTLFDTDEEEKEGKASEITLSTASLLGIFFGLVLVCGVFFGFGYSMGRGTGAGAQASAPASSAGEAAEATTPVNPPVSAPPQQQDDTPAIAKAEPPPIVTHPKAVETPKEDTSASEEAAAASVPKTVSEPRPEISKPAAGRQTAAYVPPTDAPPSATGTGQAMVQIAAVARPEDANVLVSALRQRGYGVVVRTEPQDKLLHVQVGPFANRMQATAIKQKLLSDGYNAIIKQ